MKACNLSKCEIEIFILRVLSLNYKYNMQSKLIEKQLNNF